MKDCPVPVSLTKMAHLLRQGHRSEMGAFDGGGEWLQVWDRGKSCVTAVITVGCVDGSHARLYEGDVLKASLYLPRCLSVPSASFWATSTVLSTDSRFVYTRIGECEAIVHVVGIA